MYIYIYNASYRFSTAEPASGTPAARFNIRWIVTSSRLSHIRVQGYGLRVKG